MVEEVPVLIRKVEFLIMEQEVSMLIRKKKKASYVTSLLAVVPMMESSMKPSMEGTSLLAAVPMMESSMEGTSSMETLT